MSNGNVDLVMKKIRHKDSFLDNAIYRGCFSDFSRQKFTIAEYDSQLDYLIDIGDFSLMNQIMSSFLSRCRLPNIVINKRVNVTSVEKRMDAGLADSLMSQCVESGFISLDCAPEIQRMICRELPSEFGLQIDSLSASLHPLTFIVSAETSESTAIRNCFIPTEYLMTDQGQEFLKTTYPD